MAKIRPHPKDAPTGEASSRIEPDRGRKMKRELLLGLGAFVGFLAISLGFLTALNPAMRWAVVGAFVSARGEQPLDLTIVHTNDNWGYVLPCG